MNKLLFLCGQINDGQSVLRAFLNLRLAQESLSGNTIDVGGGKNAKYLSFMKKEERVNFKTFDLKAGQFVNFETDTLPASDGEYDTVLFLNVMEHIFNHTHIAREVVRITKNTGQLIGFVPFLMWYHPDHSDYFRYTHEALEKIFKGAGATNITVESISRGPFAAACHMILLSFPRLLRVPIFLLFYGLDSIFLMLRASHAERYALGYYFFITKQ